MVKIVWTELSISDLQEIFDSIAIDSIRYASITANKIYDRVQPIKDNPYLGKMVPEFSEKSIREVIEGNYRIIYRINQGISYGQITEKEEYKVISGLYVTYF
jgi:toxin ParE1/3/4